MTGAVIQVRMDSTRLPGKALAMLAGRPALAHIIERLERASMLDTIIVATTARDVDRPIAELSREMGAEVFTGSLDDVLDRYYRAAVFHGLDSVVRITGDCPLVEPQLVDKAVAQFLSGGFDYVSTSYPVTSFPDGLDVEVFSLEALGKAWTNAKLRSEREHVTPYIWKNVNREFETGMLQNDVDLSAKRWTLDGPDDLKLISAIYERFYRENPCFGMAEVMVYLREHPELESVNSKSIRNEGYLRSVAQDGQEGG